jgi:hypothetical protein
VRRNRYAKRKDTTQDAIVGALRAAGWAVWIIGWPCDLLCHKDGRGFRTLECKSPRNKRGAPRLDKRQAQQTAFVQLTRTPYVTTPFEALLALGEVVSL